MGSCGLTASSEWPSSAELLGVSNLNTLACVRLQFIILPIFRESELAQLRLMLKLS